MWCWFLPHDSGNQPWPRPWPPHPAQSIRLASAAPARRPVLTAGSPQPVTKCCFWDTWVSSFHDSIRLSLNIYRGLRGFFSDILEFLLVVRDFRTETDATSATDYRILQAMPCKYCINKAVKKLTAMSLSLKHSVGMSWGPVTHWFRWFLGGGPLQFLLMPSVGAFATLAVVYFLRLQLAMGPLIPSLGNMIETNFFANLKQLNTSCAWSIF